MTPTPPANVRIQHPDGTATPVDITFVTHDPRMIQGEIQIIDIWEVASPVEWVEGDEIHFDWPDDNTTTVAIRALRSQRIGDPT